MIKTIIKNDLKYIQMSSFLDRNIFHGFFSRLGGVSKQPYSSLNLGGTTGDEENNIIENRKRIFDCINRPVQSIYDVWQVHGNDVIITDRARKLGTSHLPADGIITNSPSVTLLMRFADCVPIIFADPLKNVVGIAHAGWQGTIKKVCQKVVNGMTENFGCDPANILAGIGPSIGPDHYFVGESVVNAAKDQLESIFDKVIIYKDGRIVFDLWMANSLLLQEIGVSQIECSEICTYCNVDDWYSYRREGLKSGRFGVVIGIN